MSLPEFYLIGAPRCGTTTVYHALREHPDVFLPALKEPRTLAYPDGVPRSTAAFPMGNVPDDDAYRALFNEAPKSAVRGDASTNYLSSPEARHRIHHDRPDAKIIAVLREPAERAYSNFMQHRRDDTEPLSFEEALAAAPERMAEGWSPYYDYRRMSTYAADLAAWQTAFPDMLVLLYDDLRDHPVDTVRRVYEFIGVDTAHAPSVVKHNASGIRKDKGVAHRVLRSRSPFKRVYNAALPERLRLRIWVWLRNRTLTQAAKPEDVLATLRKDMAGDVERTATLIGRDLSRWLP